MNKVILIGRLTKKPELRYAGANLPVTTFTLAVNRAKEGADFIKITVFNKQAENVEKYIDKGSMVAVEGKIQTSKYEKDGKTQYNTEIIADTVRFLSNKINNTTNNKNASNDDKNELEQDIKDMDLGW